MKICTYVASSLVFVGSLLSIAIGSAAALGSTTSNAGLNDSITTAFLGAPTTPVAKPTVPLSTPTAYSTPTVEAEATTCTPQNPSGSRPQITCPYRVAYITPLGNDLGAWRDCQQVFASVAAGTVYCDIASTTGHTVTTTVGGSLDVTIGTIDASVGYEVDKSTTVTGGRTFNIPAHEGGWLKWVAVYHNRYSVAQELYTCIKYVPHPRVPLSGSSPAEAQDVTCSPDNSFKFATTQQYDTFGINFFQGS